MANDTGRPRLRELRRDLGWTQQEMAERLANLAWMRRREHVAVNADMIAKWERGAKGVSPRYRELLCLLFGVTPDQLGLGPGRGASAPVPRPVGADDESLVGMLDNAAAVLDQLGAAGTALAPQMLEVWKDTVTNRHAMFALLDPGATDPAGHARTATATVDDLEALAGRYRDLYPTAAPAPLLTAVAAHVRMVGEALSRDPSPAERVRLLRNRARVAILAGRLAAEDLGNSMSGHAYFSVALDAAREADDDHLAAVALGYAARLTAADGCLVAALDRLAIATPYAEHSPVIRSWLASIEAVIHADRGDHHAAAKALDRAGTTLDVAGTDTMLASFDRPRLAAVTGHVALRAGDHTRARDALTEALRDLEPTARRERIGCLIDLATAELHTGNHPEACLLATKAAELLSRAPYATGTARLQAFRTAARTLNRRVLRALDTNVTNSAA